MDTKEPNSLLEVVWKWGKQLNEDEIDMIFSSTLDSFLLEHPNANPIKTPGAERYLARRLEKDLFLYDSAKALYDKHLLQYA